MRLQPPDQLSTLLIWISDAFMAIKAGIEELAKSSGKPPVIDLGGLWGFLPLALLTIAGGITLLRSVAPRSGTPAQENQPAIERQPIVDDFTKRYGQIMLIIILAMLAFRLMDLLPAKH